MKFTLDTPAGDYFFSDYGNGALTINETPYYNSLLIFPDKVLEWDVTDIHELELAHFQPLIDANPDIIILGTGASQRFPSLALRKALLQQKIQLDIMDTAAACRTYNLLLSEDRNVAAGVIVF